MSSMPPRKQSDLTIPIDRALLPPVSVRSFESLGLDPNHPEAVEALEQAREELRKRPTLVPCPACKPCTACHGARMVTAEEAARYQPDE